MKKVLVMVSRHTPTPEQHALAAADGCLLVSIGDTDAFTITPEWVYEQADGIDFDALPWGDLPKAEDREGEYALVGVIVVHPAALARLIGAFDVGVFENATRSEEGGKPTFYAKALHRYPCTR